MSKKLYCGHPYAHSLNSAINILVYIINIIIIITNPSIFPPIYPFISSYFLDTIQRIL